jgi:hypothetical protein
MCPRLLGHPVVQGGMKLRRSIIRIRVGAMCGPHLNVCRLLNGLDKKLSSFAQYCEWLRVDGDAKIIQARS